MNINPEVDKYLKKKNHPLTNEIQKIREIILSSDDRIEETIKWNSPTFVYKGNIASFFMNAKKFVSLMFHKGKFIKDRYGLLEGDGKETRVARFQNMEDIENKKEALQSIIREWVKMKTIIIFVISIFINYYSFGQTAPKMEPVFHLHRELSNIRDFTLSSTGQECYTTLQSPLGEISVIIRLKKEGNNWTNPKIMPFSGKYKDMEPFLSPDNLRLYFASNRPRSDTNVVSKDFDIWYVERKNLEDEWGVPVNLGEPINSMFDEFYPSVALNHNLYITSNRTGTKGKDDIFFCKWNGHEYDLPVSLSDSINTPGYEFNAFVNPDESYIIFSGYNRKDGYGSGDLYISYKNRDSEWGIANNLGKAINSKYLDYCPFVDIISNTLYFTSKRSDFKEINNFKTIDEVVEEINKAANGMSSIYKISNIEFIKSEKSQH